MLFYEQARTSSLETLDILSENKYKTRTQNGKVKQKKVGQKQVNPTFNKKEILWSKLQCLD